MTFTTFDPSDEGHRRFLEYLPTVPWKAGSYMHGIITEGKFHERFGQSARLYFVTDGDEQGAIAGFCALLEQDFAPVPEYRPWIAFMYVAPAYRGHRLSQAMVSFLEGRALEQGWTEVHILTRHHGLYEKYGYSLVRGMPSERHGVDYIYVKELEGE